MISHSKYDFKKWVFEANTIHVWNSFRTSRGKEYQDRNHLSLADEQREFFAGLLNIDLLTSIKITRLLNIMADLYVNEKLIFSENQIRALKGKRKRIAEVIMQNITYPKQNTDIEKPHGWKDSALVLDSVKITFNLDNETTEKAPYYRQQQSQSISEEKDVNS